MTDTLPEPPEIDPAGLAGTSFSRARRGFEPAEVHAALGRAADALRAWKLRDAHLSARLEQLGEQLADAQRLDESRLTEVLGEETARIVAAARDAAHEIRTHAEQDAERLVRETAEEANSAAEAMKGEAAALRDEAARLRDEAAAEATRVRSEAEAESTRLRSEAEAESTRVRSEADELATNLRSEAEAAASAMEAEARARHDELLAEAEGVLALRTAAAEEVAAGITEAATAELESARADAERLRVEVAEESAAILEAAREEGRSMVAEAKAVRERILRDLVERRATARRQIEAARAGRDRIVEVLRSTIDDVSGTIEGLGDAEQAAGEAAAHAASGVQVDTEAEVAELLVELGEDPAAVHDATIVVPGVGGVDLEPEQLVETGGGTELEQDAPAEQAAPEDATPAQDASTQASSADGAGAGEQVAAAEQDVPADAAVAGGAEPDEDDHDEQPGATVHDLFARIRAEGLEGSDEDGEPTGEHDGQDERDAGAPDDGDDAEHDGSADGDEEPGRPDTLAAAVGDEGIDLTVPNVAVLPSGGAEASTAAEPASEPAAVATLETPAQLLDLRDELLAPVEKSLSRVLRRLASDEQNELLDQLRRIKRGRPDADALLAPHRAAGTDRFVEALLPDFARAADAGGEFWARVSGASADALFADDDLLRDRLTDRVAGFLDLHRAHLERTFGDAEAEGLDVAELADRVRAAYRDWRSGSLADHAGDLATAGFAHGERRAAGPGTPWRWVVDNGGLPCADGEDNALAGAVPCEEPFPTGDVTPPAHPGCRCILAPAHQ